MLKFPKDKRTRNKPHLEFIASLPCVKCLSEFKEYTESEAHHIRLQTDGGIGRKPSDFCAISLCRFHHDECHRKGEKRFYDPQSAITLAKSLYEVTGQRDKAIKLIKGSNL